VKPSDVARRAGYSRQHLALMRDGHLTSARSEDAVVQAFEKIRGETVERETLFEPRQVLRLASLLPAPSARRDRRKSGKEEKPADILGAMTDLEFERSLVLLHVSNASEAMIRELLDAGLLLLDRNPRRAEALFGFASETVERLARLPAALAHSLRGLAEKGRANALRMTGRYEDALRALERSERELAAARYCRRELAYARYCRAAVLFKMERWVEAYRAVHGARSLFEAQHDRAGVVNCDILKACITLEWGELDRAREMFLALRKTIEARRDYRRLADLWMNLVVCDLRRGDTFEAGLWLGRAMRKFRELGLASEVTRGRWCGATLALAQGQRTHAVREFRAAAEEFEELGMPMDAAFVKLELLGELVDEKKWREAEPIALSLASLFLKAGVGPSAATALDYLRETVKGRSADRDVVRRVRRHIRRVEVFPDERFTEGPA
jgi:tetratricopeptide (TPR) repeat protein